MKETTLSAIKKRIREFIKVYSATVSCFHEAPHFTTIEVILSNMAFDSSNCVNSTHLDSVNKLYKEKNALRALAHYYKSHVEQWVYEEIEMIIDGLVQYEDFEQK